MIELSIIVPVYNVKNYIRKCVLSLFDQNISYKKYEVILVDDGDTENSLDEVEDLIDNDNVVVLHKENGGLSSARNYGMKMARGRYLWFVDSDDWIERNCLKDVLAVLSDSPDVVYQTNQIPEGNRIVPIALNIKEDIIASSKLFSIPHSQGVPFYLYKRAFLLSYHLCFEEGIYHEDTLFTPRALYYSKKVKLIKKPVYHVLLRENSITTVFKPKRCYDLMFIIGSLIEFYKKEVDDCDKKAFSNEITDSLLFMLSLTVQAGKDVRKDVDDFVNHIENIDKLISFSYRRRTRAIGYLSKIPFFTIPRAYRLLYYLRSYFTRKS